MENFNTVPDKGTFGGSVEVINQNFSLAQQGMEVLQNKCENESARATEAENSLRQLYNNLQQSQPIPVTALPATGEAGKIYRLAGTNSYADYMYSENDLTTPIKMAEYDNAIDDEPTLDSNNLVKSRGVASYYGIKRITSVNDYCIAIRHIVDQSAESSSGNRYTLLYPISKGSNINLQSNYDNIGITTDLYSFNSLTDAIKGASNSNKIESYTSKDYTTSFISARSSSDGYLRITFKKNNDTVILDSDITDMLNSLSIQVYPTSGAFYQKTPVSLIADYYGESVTLNADTKEISFGDDSILLYGQDKYVIPRGTTIDYSNINSSAIKVVFNVSSLQFSAILWSQILSDEEILIGGIRHCNDNNTVAVDFPFRIDIIGGKSLLPDDNNLSVSLIADYYTLKSPRLYVESKKIVFGDDCALVYGSKYFVLPKYLTIDYSTIGPTAIKIIFDTYNYQFNAIPYNQTLAVNEILIGGIRHLSDNKVAVDFPFDVDIVTSNSINEVPYNIINNSNIEQSYYYPYPVPYRRGRIVIPILNPNDFNIFVYNTNIDIKFAIQLLSRITDEGGSYVAETSWQNELIMPTFLNNKTMLTNNSVTPKYIAIVATDRETGTQQISYENMLSSLKFEVCQKIESLPVKIKLQPNITVCAHRGLWTSGIPENSLDAYIAAGIAGYKYAETDICLTADGVIVLMHDDTINRTMRNKSNYSVISESVSVISKTFEELKSNYVLACDIKKYRKSIPTFEEFLNVCKMVGIHPLIEIKTTGITQEKILEAYTMALSTLGSGNFSFGSFNYSFLDYVRTLDSDVDLFYFGATQLLPDRKNKHNIWAPNYTQGTYGLTKTLVQELHNNGMRVGGWCELVNSADEVKEFNRLVDMGLDYITGDYNGVNDGKSDVIISSENFWNLFSINGGSTTLDYDGCSGIIELPQNSTISWKGDYCLASYNIQIILQGEATISAPNLLDSINSENEVVLNYCGLCINKIMSLTITAINSGCTVKSVKIGLKNMV